MSAKNIKYLRSLEIILIAVSLGLSLDAKQSSLSQEPPAPQQEKVEDLEINVYGGRC